MEFSYEVKRVACAVSGGKEVVRTVVRTVCDGCQESRKKWVTKRTRKPRAAGTLMAGTAKTPRERVAEAMGLSADQVEHLERTALTRLRTSTELRQAYDIFKESGMPKIEELIQIMRQPADNTLLGHVLDLADFWRIHEQAKQAGLTQECREIMADIARCHSLIKRELGARS